MDGIITIYHELSLHHKSWQHTFKFNLLNETSTWYPILTRYFPWKKSMTALSYWVYMIFKQKCESGVLQNYDVNKFRYLLSQNHNHNFQTLLQHYEWYIWMQPAQCFRQSLDEGHQALQTKPRDIKLEYSLHARNSLSKYFVVTGYYCLMFQYIFRSVKLTEYHMINVIIVLS